MVAKYFKGVCASGPHVACHVTFRRTDPATKPPVVESDVDANDGPRERSLTEEVNPKTPGKSTLTKYREEKSRRS